MISTSDVPFRYTPSFDTDISKTFARVRLAHRKAAEAAAQSSAEANDIVDTTAGTGALAPASVR